MGYPEKTSGFSLIAVTVWTILDPRHSYLLDLVHFSEDVPLLRGAAYLMIIVGTLTLLVGFVACCASTQKLRCPLVTLILFLLIISPAEIVIGSLAIAYRKKQ
ncbi:unnamed protein product [Enterobius vermicularis]|uniref:Tetraspanin-8-like n=1 Tax=Enterobius vermicularis TaxID=51028 RepID=A0A0N4VEI9_ENTVE|nr:unnamed protein product [Enterobius vermicularis]